MRLKVLGALFVFVLVLGISGIAFALSSYKTQFNTRYGTTGSAIDQCILCHATNSGPSIPSTETPPNPYGVALETNGLNFAAIEPVDSDGDGFTNIAEITARTFPGNAASRPAASDTIPPTVSGFTVPATSSSLTISITSFTATDNTAVTGYMVTESATAPAATAAGWTATAPTSYTAATAGAKTLYAWAKDAAGNVSASRSASVTITLPDTTPPTVSGFTIPATASSLAVPITSFTATDNIAVTGYIVTESATTPAAAAAGWTATAPTGYTAATAGAKTLYAWAKDAAGNVSASRSASVTITLADTTLPTVTGFTIPATSSSLAVSITSLTATDNVAVTGFMVTESATKPSATVAGWTATAPTGYTAATAGAKTLYAWAKDAAGNVSASRSASVTITLSDTTLPTVIAFSIPATSTSLAVPITSFVATDNTGVTGFMVTESPTKPLAAAAGWTTTAPANYTFASAGAKTLYAWAKDAAGNVSNNLSASVTITPGSPGPPAASWLQFGSGATPSAPSIAWSPSASKFFVGIRGTDSKIYIGSLNLDGSFNNDWTALPTGGTPDAPAIAWNPTDNRLQIVVRGDDNGIYGSSVDATMGAFSGWVKLNTGETSSPPAIAWNTTNNNLHIVIRGMDNGIYGSSVDATMGAFSGWVKISTGATSSAPAIAWNPATNSLHIAIRGMDNGIYGSTVDATMETSSGWVKISTGATPSAPAMAWNPATNSLHVAIRGMDNGIYCSTVDATMETSGGWIKIDTGATPDTPAVAIESSTNTSHMVVRGFDNRIYNLPNY